MPVPETGIKAESVPKAEPRSMLADAPDPEAAAPGLDPDPVPELPGVP